MISRQSNINLAQSFRDIRVEGQDNSIVINQIVQISVEAVKQQTLITSSPYLGLRRFDGKHHQFFFGRDEFIARLLSSLKQRSLLAVLGPSGSGKSSVVRAGLIPQLDERMAKGRFHAITFSPDRDPFLSLRSGLNEGAGISFGRTEFIRPSPQALLEMVAELRGEDEQWLLFIDQFEEVFTLCADERQRAAFLEALTRLARGEQSNVKIVLAMRADFLGQLAPYPELASLVEQGLHLLTDLLPSGLRAAIEQPAARHGVVFEEGLVEQIIRDVQQRPGALPLLQYTLDLVWNSDDDLTDRTLNTVTYHRLGGVEGALRDQAEELYNFTRHGNKKAARDPAQKDCMRRIFLRLIDYRGDVEPHPVSKRAAHADFTLPHEQALLIELVDSKLLISSSEVRGKEGDAQSLLSLLGPATVELAHEALINAWPRLSEWLKQAQEVLSLYHRLREDAKRWKDTATRNPRQAGSELWSGSRLEQAVELRQQGEFSRLLNSLNESESAFLDAGVELHERRSLEEDERRLRKLQALQRELDDFIERGRLLLLSGRPTEAAVWLFGAYERGSQHPMLPYLLRQAMLHVERVHAVLLGHTGPILTIEYSRDGRRLVTASEDGTARIWDAQAGVSLAELRGHQGTVRKASFDPRGERVLTAGEDGTAKIWDAASGTLLHSLGDHNGAVTASEFHPNGQAVLTASSSAVLRIWNGTSGLLQKDLHGHVGVIRCACFSPDGTLILSAGTDGSLRLWDTESCELVAVLKSSGSAIVTAGFSPDGSKIAAVAEDRSVQLWHTHTRTPVQRLELAPTPRSHQDRIVRFTFSPDGEMLATASDDATAGFYKLFGNSNLQASWCQGHCSPVTQVAFHPQGDLLCTASEDGTVKLWRQEREFVTFRGPTRSVAQAIFSPDGRYVAACSADGTAWIWSAHKPEICAELGRTRESVQDFLPSPDGRLLVTWESKDDSPNSVRLWDLPSAQSLGSIKAADSVEAGVKISAVQFSRDGLLLMVAFEPSTVVVWHAAERRQIGKIVTQSPLRGAALSPDGHHAITRHEEHLRAWEIATGRVIWELEHQGSSSDHASFAPSGEYILIASDSGVIRLLDPLTGARLATFRHRASGGLFVQYSRDGTRLLLEGYFSYSLWEAQRTLRQISLSKLPPYSYKIRTDPGCRKVACWTTGGQDKVALYDTNTGSICFELEGFNKGYLRDLRFSPDGMRLAVAADGIYVFETETGKLLSRDELSPEQLQFTTDGQQLLAKVGVRHSSLYVFDVGTEQRTVSALAEILRTRVPYRLNGTTIAQAELSAPCGHAQSAPNPNLLYSERRAALWRAVYAISHGKLTEGQAWLVESKNALAQFCDAEGLAMQEFAELAVRRRIGDAVDEQQTFREILSMLGRELPEIERRADALKEAGDLALYYLDEPLLATYAYEEYLKLAEWSGKVPAALLTAHFCAGHYDAVISAADAAKEQYSDFVNYSAMLGWLATVMQRGSFALDHWSIKARNIGWGGWHDREDGVALRRAVFKARLPSEVIAQVVHLLDIGCLTNLPDTVIEACEAILDGREFVMQRIEARDFSGLLADAEGWWPHMSKLQGGRDLLWAAVFWSLALQLEDADKGLLWSNRIFELCDGSPIPRFSCSWLIEALQKQAVTIKQWQTIRRAFELFESPTNFPENRRELYALLSDSIS